jgi:predicted O-methyltransferase YrrM
MPTSRLTFVDDHLLLAGACEFHCQFPLADVPAGRLPVMKPRTLVERYIDLCNSLRPAKIVELGIRHGGSTALLSELAHPRKLVAVELEQLPAPLLTSYVEDQRLGDVVRPYYGVDQADRAQVVAIVEAEFGGEAIDLVVDDASHLYEQSRSSFETLFPRLRPGGLFVIEDWSWLHRLYDAVVAILQNPTPAQIEELERRMEGGDADREPQPVPLSRLVLELVLARATSSAAIDDITINDGWVVVRRGHDRLDRASFRVADLYRDHFDQLPRIDEPTATRP